MSDDIEVIEVLSPEQEKELREGHGMSMFGYLDTDIDVALDIMSNLVLLKDCTDTTIEEILVCAETFEVDPRAFIIGYGLGASHNALKMCINMHEAVRGLVDDMEETHD
ncbi:MAG: hypothetical protein PHZ19_06230 [Candidatus Thermoplasmatota archaeon]|nr:hypothetical protein [Candidatus Thermoplasmatota archaeon]